MNFKEFEALWSRQPEQQQVLAWMQGRSKNLHLSGFCGSAAALSLHLAQKQQGLPALYLLQDSEEAGYFYNDLVQLSSDEQVFYFPSSYKHRLKTAPVQDAANQVLRTETLNALLHRPGCTVVSYPEALCEKVPDPQHLANESLPLETGQQISLDALSDTLETFGFQPCDFVYEPGQYSIRGSIVDVFSYSSDLPYRIDFFGDDIDSIRSFDIETQRSIASLSSITIVSGQVGSDNEHLVPLWQFFAPDTLCVWHDYDLLTEAMQHYYQQAGAEPARLIGEEELQVLSSHFRHIHWGGKARQGATQIHLQQAPQPLFHKNFDWVATDFRQRQQEGYRVYVLSDNPKQIDRLSDIFSEREENITFTPVLGLLHEGFIDYEAKICVYTDHQIFERFHKYRLKSQKTRAGRVVLSMKELMQFQIGDYVVHADHGVGKFGGLIRMEANGKPQEVIKLLFKDDDIVFVNIHSLHRIAKYKSKEGEAPRLNKLGTAAWNNLKERTKKKIKDIARELIRLYAKRREEDGFRYSPDGYLQQELESSFLYEDTPDQSKATTEVKKDMESSKPMDRLICGDVGFGKTEIAIRAAFKAVCDNKQVAVLVPTTVLAFQHYQSFSRRLKRFPCRVEYLSRARKAADCKHIVSDTAAGKVDILVGTHKLLGKDVQFKDLGLLIIDEEQKFGVGAKEKLRQLRSNIDTLTLSATPIPRTLQFSLMGARDLSIITTPPPNRYPIHTELIGFDEDLIKEGIEYELARGGQVFFVNNRIHNLPELEEKLQSLVPQARIAVGHGQMDSEKLEELLLAFIHGEYDLLLSTSIIESGVDIPNVNTIFINGAQHFGLSDLHQLRGRVGRTNKKAFCYLITPSLSSLPADSRRRLQAIENFSDLGSGIHIAMQDLDIRGAGNILGGEQSGFISDLGYETYHRILDEAVQELKHDEFAELFQHETNEQPLNGDCLFESDLELLLPSDYVSSVSERMDLYRRLDAIKHESELQTFRQELEDRFGPLPEVSENLLEVLRLRWLLIRLHIEKAVLKNERFVLYFPTNSPAYYQSKAFNHLLQYVTRHPHNSRFRDEAGKRSLVLYPVRSIAQAEEMLQEDEQTPNK